MKKSILINWTIWFSSSHWFLSKQKSTKNSKEPLLYFRPRFRSNKASLLMLKIINHFVTHFIAFKNSLLLYWKILFHAELNKSFLAILCLIFECHLIEIEDSLPYTNRQIIVNDTLSFMRNLFSSNKTFYMIKKG